MGSPTGTLDLETREAGIAGVPEGEALVGPSADVGNLTQGDRDVWAAALAE